MRATDELRNLLDQHGVDYSSLYSEAKELFTAWYCKNVQYKASEFKKGRLWITAEFGELTPSQAIEVSLGSIDQEEVNKNIGKDGTCYDQAPQTMELFCCSRCCTTDEIKTPKYCHGCGRRVVMKEK